MSMGAAIWGNAKRTAALRIGPMSVPATESHAESSSPLAEAGWRRRIATSCYVNRLCSSSLTAVLSTVRSVFASL